MDLWHIFKKREKILKSIWDTLSIHTKSQLDEKRLVADGCSRELCCKFRHQGGASSTTIRWEHCSNLVRDGSASWFCLLSLHTWDAWYRCVPRGFRAGQRPSIPRKLRGSSPTFWEHFEAHRYRPSRNAQIINWSGYKRNQFIAGGGTLSFGKGSQIEELLKFDWTAVCESLPVATF
jgi:hypothetical protein